MNLQTAQLLPSGIVSDARLKIYTGILGQLGDIILFTPTVRRIRELFPNSSITFAVNKRYRGAGELVAGLPYIDRLFVTELYFERLSSLTSGPYEREWPVDLRGDDEVEEERRHDIVLETRPRHRRSNWWEHAHITEEIAHMVGVPSPIDRQTEIRIPASVRVPDEALGKIVFHNDPAIDPRKAWPWTHAVRLLQELGVKNCVILGGNGPVLEGALDLRGKTTIPEAAAVIASARCFVGIDSGLTHIAGSVGTPTVGMYGTEHIPMNEAVQPCNPRAIYLQAEGSVGELPPELVLSAVRQQLGRI
jgi:ADP-heptose:LPS heptosyltransferase